MINGERPIPFVVGTAGHRDLLREDIPALEDAVRAVFGALRDRMPATPLVLLSALAAGADQLTARVGLRCGVRLAAVLPMPRSLYRTRIPADEREGFDVLLGKASEVIALPLGGLTEAQIAASSESLDGRYEALAVYIASSCQALIALWDGIDVDKPGSTSRVVRYYLDRHPQPGVSGRVPSAEGVRLYHIHTRRQRPSAAGSPADPGNPAGFPL